MNGDATLLEVEGVTKAFGGLMAVKDLDLTIRRGELVGLIGPNGAGKTTVFNLLTGVYRVTGGDIRFEGRSIVGRKPNEITARGIARTFQNIRLFNDLEVIDNVKVACDFRASYGLPASVFRTARCREEEAAIEAKAEKLLAIFALADRKLAFARNLPYGDQRRLEIARALATEPRLLLLDEPAAGMNPKEKDELLERVLWLRKEFGLTILLIEHDMKFVMGICERIFVLDHGAKIAEGTPDEVRRNQDVIDAYLGETHGA